jgi:class 3 adenylate cyclase/predicted ATPase
MTFDESLEQTLTLLRRQGRVSYRALKVRFHLDDEHLEALKEEILYVHPSVVDDHDRGLVWTGEAETPPSEPSTPDAERRQLTVMFCDLVDSTPLSEQLDPEDLRDVVRAYQQTCADVVQRFKGHIAQLLGDALLVYFGWPQAHEDNAQRAVWTGLGMLDAMRALNTRLKRDKGINLAIRVGIHTGLVVVGEMGGGGHQEQLALGDTPNIASRLQGLAEPDTVVISQATYRLVEGYFTCQELGVQMLKGVSQPMPMYRVLGETGAQSRVEVAATRGLTPLVGREQEIALLLERWVQAKDGMGQVVLLSGEAGIGKSRLIQVMKDHLTDESHTRLECRCSPYYQNTALYPLVDLWEHVCTFARQDSPDEKLRKLERTLRQYRLPLEATVPLFAALLSVPLSGDRYPPLALLPQRQRQKTLETMLAILLELAEQQPVLFIVEDLHWVDPTSREFLDLLIDQAPTASLLTLLTCRPAYQPQWGLRTHLMPIALNRFTRTQIELMVERIAGVKRLPTDVLQQIVARTDGVPLFIEELTKAVLESGHLKETDERYELTGPLPSLSIPTTLQDSLMARLDRLASAKGIAQLGATIGRQFPYELLQAVTPVDEATLQRELERLVDAELLYQRGLPPQATYVFKHALIQDAAYQSLLKSTQQQYHRHIAKVLEDRFKETAETQPELLAHHYTEANLNEQAIDYWQWAGEKAIQRSANVEAIAHLTRGLELLKMLPDTPERMQKELVLLTKIGPAFIATKGSAAPEVESIYTRAQKLCQQVETTSQLFPVVRALSNMSLARGELRTAHEFAEQCLNIAQRAHEVTLLVEAYWILGATQMWRGAFAPALEYVEQGIALHDPQQHTFPQAWQDPGVACLCYCAVMLWYLGYPDTARARSHEALSLAQKLSHPYSIIFSHFHTARVYQLRRESHIAHEQADAVITGATGHGFEFFEARGTVLRGWALAEQGQGREGIAQIHQGINDMRASGAALGESGFYCMLAKGYKSVGQIEDGLAVLLKALAYVQETEERYHEAELYRLKGELLLDLSAENHKEAEPCFHQALDIARHQQAKSLELRATMSLSRLWQQQGKHAEARELLLSIYNWFTEGFDTADLQEAKVLLEELVRGRGQG